MFQRQFLYQPLQLNLKYPWNFCRAGTSKNFNFYAFHFFSRKKLPSWRHM
jgi:hypothetical protein